MTNDDNPFSSFYGKRFSVSGKDLDDGNGNGHDEQEEEKLNEQLEVRGNSHDGKEENTSQTKNNKRRQSKERKYNDSEDDKDKETIKVKTHTVYKYSTDLPLAEEILLNNESVFLQIID